MDENELVERIIKEDVEIYLKKWFNSEGIERTVELVENFTDGKVKGIYMEALRNKGLVK